MYDQKLYYRYLISLGIIIFVIIFYIKGGKFDPSILLTASSAAGVTIILDKFIVKTILWKLCPDLFYTCKLTNIPFLGGCWEGTLESNYKPPGTDAKLPPIPARIEIRHEFDSIHIKMETNQSYSSSYVSGVIEDEGKQKFLCYLYGNDADKDREVNPKHDGATRLRIKHDGTVVLEGHYWTGRETTGSMYFTRKSKKNLPI
ncbi:hypothetical protein SIL80_24760 [Bacillus cereus group sp. BfR-BA-01119]|uniref:CD-NTase-associated protein 15 domain-containing protein n=1 Tax=Bacillus paranthracis TaxID=2026186 RepID=A0AAX3QLH2_9BACI|nr:MULTISPECIES: hypothetical protein [Bacillus cereus group]EEK45158.1 hypothetical protein bcere0001_17930 [Bacillus cereus m1293]EJR09321.1 hypothetical protein II9_05529 [Bacillus cereus MSX-D12]AUD25149.1 hypothetical protein CU648_23040 [Bacillus sp. HBCD-sjtu]KMP41814.1 hypothetical protein TU55_22025 [Bacillus cereus]MCM0005602.1 hypothetical protein [Bacillus paranthracis]